MEIRDLPQFVQLTENLTLDSNSSQILITDNLENSNIHIKENCDITFIAYLEKGWKENKKITFNLEGKNSTLNFIAFIIAKENDTFPFETLSNHTTTNTNAYYYVRAVQYDKSKVDYTGMLKINPQAQQTDSYLAHHTLMLSPNAKTNTTPSLEIEADDVAAGHAATMGRVDEELLFYLQSRGINKKEAKDMLVKGFMQTELEKIPSEEIRELLTEKIENSVC
ncbi:hypothetical protein COU74_00715 [Candidatus Peregrinibacteria bacterium CG10_big_fil_rev_8_21_14_0_10_36_19]|nr:MAG: hypothetical protein COU74_00715 [Candidatus Peregrinibacteria bacterium CG10_big_fil_rev_8_21_14_0_10_36_19]